MKIKLDVQREDIIKFSNTIRTFLNNIRSIIIIIKQYFKIDNGKNLKDFQIEYKIDFHI